MCFLSFSCSPLETQGLCFVSSSCKSATNHAPCALSKPSFLDLPNTFLAKCHYSWMTLRWSYNIFPPGQLRACRHTCFLESDVSSLKCVFSSIVGMHTLNPFTARTLSATLTAGFSSHVALNLDAPFKNRAAFQVHRLFVVTESPLRIFGL